MAKTKQSPALFEVIARSRPLNGRARSGLVSSITRWFRWNRNGAAQSMPAARPAPVAPTISAPSAPSPSPAPIQPVVDAGPLPSRRAAITIDPDRYEITLRFSYVSGIICVFAVITLVAAAFVAGGGVSGGSQPLFANGSSPQLREQGPTSTLLKIEKTPVNVDMPAEGEPAGTSQHTATELKRPAGQASRTRKAGLNYVIIQSYPELAMANEAVKVLTENGIDCTVEKLPDWAAKNWHTVLGLEGFDKISNSPRYEAYLKKIRDISDKYAKKSSFKAFTPSAYRWGGKSK